MYGVYITTRNAHPRTQLISFLCISSAPLSSLFFGLGIITEHSVDENCLGITISASIWVRRSSRLLAYIHEIKPCMPDRPAGFCVCRKVMMMNEDHGLNFSYKSGACIMIASSLSLSLLE